MTTRALRTNGPRKQWQPIAKSVSQNEIVNGSRPGSVIMIYASRQSLAAYRNDGIDA